jgi:3',5'-cyclic AMP phosphodiesterase CpdA
MPKTLFRFAHLSDLHFSHLSWEPSQLFSKRWIGSLNVLLARQHAFASDHLSTLFPIFHEKKIDTVLITGDLSSTAHKKEFEKARHFVDGLKQEGFRVLTLPGNHDHYTKQAYRTRLFYQFFDPCYAVGAPSLSTEGVTAIEIGKGWWIVALDTAIATPIYSSQGFFSQAIEKHLESVLQQIPSHNQILLMNHFPLFSTDSPRKSLIRREALQHLIERHPNVKLFLHGHTHRSCIADLRKSHLPILLDSGATGLKKEGSWNAITLTDLGCQIETLSHQDLGRYTAWETVASAQITWGKREALV